MNKRFAHDGGHGQRDAVELALPDYKQMRRSLSRNYLKQFPKIDPDNPNTIPASLTQTSIGATSEDPTDERHREVYLRVREVNPTFFVFISNLDLETLHGASQGHCDSTFKFRPSQLDCRELYVIVVKHLGEYKPAVHALLAQKSRDCYIRFFTYLRTLLVDKFGNIGAMEGGRYIFDFEQAAIDASKQV